MVTNFVAPAPPVPPATPTPSIAPAAPAGKETVPLPEVPAELKLRLRDSSVATQVYNEQLLQPTIAAPLEFLEVIRPQFVPAQPGEPNRLEVTVARLPQMTLPACPVTLIVPSDKEIFPGFVEPPKGKLGGNLDPNGDDLHLKAQDIKLDPAKSEEGRFQLTIDGLERVLWYKTQFRIDGETQIATRDTTPRVRFNPDLKVEPGQKAKLHVEFTVDNAPPDAKLTFHLGQTKSGKLVDEIKVLEMTPKHRHIGFDPVGPGGALSI